MSTAEDEYGRLYPSMLEAAWPYDYKNKAIFLVFQSCTKEYQRDPAYEGSFPAGCLEGWRKAPSAVMPTHNFDVIDVAIAAHAITE